MSVTFFGYGNPELEALGVRLATYVSARLREAIPRECATPGGLAPIGPDFQYETGPDLFLGRRGRGPLRVIWDTNILIDYFEHARALWDGDVPDLDPASELYAELEALQIVMALWVVRDLRFHILPRVLTDAKRGLSKGRMDERRRAFVEFSRALTMVGESSEVDTPREDSPLILPVNELLRVLRHIPEGGDRDLVSGSIRMHGHVFMTRDTKVLASRDRLKPFGLVVASPGDLLGELAACGALHCLLLPRYYLRWPLPDQGRVTHLLQALPLRSSVEA